MKIPANIPGILFIEGRGDLTASFKELINSINKDIPVYTTPSLLTAIDMYVNPEPDEVLPEIVIIGDEVSDISKRYLIEYYEFLLNVNEQHKGFIPAAISSLLSEIAMEKHSLSLTTFIYVTGHSYPLSPVEQKDICEKLNIPFIFKGSHEKVTPRLQSVYKERGVPFILPGDKEFEKLPYTP